MSIGLLRVTNFRNLSAIDITPATQGLNILHGHNGSGKTSFLEAIYYLALGRSFRAANATKLIRFQTDKFSIFSRIVGDFERDIPLGVERTHEGSTRIKIAEREVTNIAELAAFLPLRLINSQSHDLFESGPLHRRKYLDWGLFYYSEQFLPCWRQFERALKQRNAILREKKSLSELNAWTEELLKHGLLLDHLRKNYVAALKPLLAELSRNLLGMEHFELHYQPGWEEGIDLAKKLSHHHEAYRLGYTAHGPHRADIDLLNQGVAVKHFLSRGQQKLLICAMIVAQGMLLTLQGKKAPIYLIDDLPAELDEYNRKQLLSLFTAQPTQVFITTIDRDTINKVMPHDDQWKISLNMFHVEHGMITQG